MIKNLPKSNQSKYFLYNHPEFSKASFHVDLLQCMRRTRARARKNTKLPTNTEANRGKNIQIKNRNKKDNNRRKAYRQSILGRTGRHRTNDTYKRALRSRRNDQFFLARVGLLSVHEKDVPTRMEASTPESSLIGRRCPPIGILMGRLTPRLTIPQWFIMDMSHFFASLCGRVNIVDGEIVRKFGWLNFMIVFWLYIERTVYVFKINRNYRKWHDVIMVREWKEKLREILFSTNSYCIFFG